MSITRMCETDSGAWILGSHAADWSKNPLITRQYIFAQRGQGQFVDTTARQNAPTAGFSPKYGRMDEGRPIYLGKSEVYFHGPLHPLVCIWESRSMDDGKTWADPKPSALVHPDAPPMVFHLSDDKNADCIPPQSAHQHTVRRTDRQDGWHARQGGNLDFIVQGWRAQLE